MSLTAAQQDTLQNDLTVALESRGHTLSVLEEWEPNLVIEVELELDEEVDVIVFAESREVQVGGESLGTEFTGRGFVQKMIDTILLRFPDPKSDDIKSASKSNDKGDTDDKGDLDDKSNTDSKSHLPPARGLVLQKRPAPPQKKIFRVEQNGVVLRCYEP